MLHQAIQDSLRIFDKYYHDVRSETRDSDPAISKQAYATLTHRFESLEKGFDPYFQPIFDEFWISSLIGPGIDDYQEVLAELRQIPGVMGTSPFCSFPTAAFNHERVHASVEVRGVEICVRSWLAGARRCAAL